MESSIKTLIEKKNYNGLREALKNNPALVNEDIPYSDENPAKAHPLHRICDGVFENKYTDEEAVEMAKIFIEAGANINGNSFIEKQDTPLVAAASLHADKVAILYIENGAELNHGGCHGGTALHWACWCGRDKVVKKFIEKGADINKKCIDFTASPLFWAVHGLKNGGGQDEQAYLACVKLLIDAGADKNIPNVDGNTVLDLLADDDKDFKELLG